MWLVKKTNSGSYIVSLDLAKIIEANGGLQECSAEVANILLNNEEYTFVQAKSIYNYRITFDVFKLIEEKYGKEIITDEDFVQAVNQYSLELLNTIRSDNGLPLLNSISHTVAKFVVQYYQGQTEIKNKFLLNISQLNFEDMRKLDEILSVVNEITLYTNKLSNKEVQPYIIDTSEKISSIIGSSKRLMDVFKVIKERTKGGDVVELSLVDTIKKVLEGAIGISEKTDEEVRNSVRGLLFNFFFWDNQIVDIVQINKIISKLFGTGNNLSSIINEYGKINDDIFSRYAGTLNNEETRLIYNFIENILHTNIDQSEMNFFEKAEMAYHVRNSLRVMAQNLSIGANSLPGKGTNPWVESFESTFVYNALSFIWNADSSIAVKKVMFDISKMSVLSENARTVINHLIKEGQNQSSSDYTKKNYQMFTAEDIKIIANTLKESEDVVKCICNVLVTNAFKSNEGVNGSLGLSFGVKEE